MAPPRDVARSAEVGSAACTASETARAAGEGVVVEAASGMMLNTTITEPATMPVTSRREAGTPRAPEMSLRNDATNAVRAGVPSAMAVISTAMVALTSTGAGFSLTYDVVGEVAVACPPPVVALPAVRMMFPVMTSPFFGKMRQTAWLSEMCTSGVHGILPVVASRYPVSGSFAAPKFFPVMVNFALAPASTCAGAIIVICGNS
mmetsp:Transcript_7987/g.19440  ORF Transcript_7987/g.19440 Transcript_7987/m.19440 type:complete len:204 (+) Transcript_7987:474-1085(+)